MFVWMWIGFRLWWTSLERSSRLFRRRKLARECLDAAAAWRRPVLEWRGKVRWQRVRAASLLRKTRNLSTRWTTLSRICYSTSPGDYVKGKLHLYSATSCILLLQQRCVTQTGLAYSLDRTKAHAHRLWPAAMCSLSLLYNNVQPVIHGLLLIYDLRGMEGWVDKVGWPIADTFPT